MRNLVTSTLLSLAVGLTSLLPATGTAGAAGYASPLRSAPATTSLPSANQPIDVQYRRGHDGGIYRRGGHHYYNGYRGYPRYRRGYRQHGDFFFPLAAFAAGAIIGSAASQPRVIYRDQPRVIYRERPRVIYRERPRVIYQEQPRVIYRERPRHAYRGGLPRDHVQYCYSRYRSYRVSDNSFQPYHGSRRACRSPYY